MISNTPDPAPASQPAQEHEHEFAEFEVCRICGRTEAAIANECHHCDESLARGARLCWWCLRPTTAPPALPSPQEPLQGTWAANDPRRWFVAGAAWWEFELKGATMWGSDRDKAEAEAERRLQSTPAAAPSGWQPSDRDAAIDRIVQRVAELLDRTSPDDWPDAMMITADELREILRDEWKPKAEGRSPNA